MPYFQKKCVQERSLEIKAPFLLLLEKAEIALWKIAHLNKPSFLLNAFLNRKRKTDLTIIKLTVWLFTVDYIKSVSNACPHSADFKVKPLVIMIAVYIRVQNEIILISKDEQKQISLKIKGNCKCSNKIKIMRSYFLIWIALRRFPDSNLELNFNMSPSSGTI